VDQDIKKPRDETALTLANLHASGIRKSERRCLDQQHRVGERVTKLIPDEMRTLVRGAISARFFQRKSRTGSAEKSATLGGRFNTQVSGVLLDVS
jgi:hypothetical protein